MLFFSDCKSLEDAKTVYHRLAMLFHPDKGGDADLMKSLNEQYKKFKNDEDQVAPKRFEQPRSFWSTNMHPRYSYNTATEAENNRVRAELELLQARYNNLLRDYQSCKTILYSESAEKSRMTTKIQELQSKCAHYEDQLKKIPTTFCGFIKWKWFTKEKYD